MKICKDCNYFRGPAPMSPKGDAKCTHISAETQKDMVFGHIMHYTCQAMRTSTQASACGVDAKHYQPLYTRSWPE